LKIIHINPINDFRQFIGEIRGHISYNGSVI